MSGTSNWKTIRDKRLSERREAAAIEAAVIAAVGDVNAPTDADREEIRRAIAAYKQSLATDGREVAEARGEGEHETVRAAWVRFLNDAEFHAEVHLTRELLREQGIEVTKIKAATDARLR